MIRVVARGEQKGPTPQVQFLKGRKNQDTTLILSKKIDQKIFFSVIEIIKKLKKKFIRFFNCIRPQAQYLIATALLVIVQYVNIPTVIMKHYDLKKELIKLNYLFETLVLRLLYFY